jgi:hypothetical protein
MDACGTHKPSRDVKANSIVMRRGSRKPLCARVAKGPRAALRKFLPPTIAAMIYWQNSTLLSARLRLIVTETWNTSAFWVMDSLALPDSS